MAIYETLAGMSLNDSDQVLINYLGFLSDNMPMRVMRFVHVLPLMYLIVEKEKAMRTMYDNLRLEKKAADDLGDRISKTVTHSRVKFQVLEGWPLEQLLYFSEKVGSELVAIGKRPGAEHHGILAKNFARKVKGNALLVPDKATANMDHILVAIDFSPNSVNALRTALALSKSFKNAPPVTALHVYELPIFQSYLLRKSYEEMRSVLIEDREAAFESFLSTHLTKEDRQRVKTEIIEQSNTDTAGAIMHYAREHAADLIVTGAKGHSMLGLLLMGSVTEKLLGITTDIPVLVTKK